MARITREQAANKIGSGRLTITTAGTERPLSDGRILLDTGSITAATIGFVTKPVGGNATITDSGNGFVTAGFTAGMIIRVSGSTSNNGTFHIIDVDAGVLTLDAQHNLTTEAAGATINVYENIKVDAIRLNAPTSNTGVLYIGPVGVSSINGDELASGSTIAYEIADLSTIYLDTATNGNIVTFSFIYIKKS